MTTEVKNECEDMGPVIGGFNLPINTIRANKEKLQDDIINLINQFEKLNGVPITGDIQITRESYSYHGHAQIYACYVAIQI